MNFIYYNVPLLFGTLFTWTMIEQCPINTYKNLTYQKVTCKLKLLIFNSKKNVAQSNVYYVMRNYKIKFT